MVFLLNFAVKKPTRQALTRRDRERDRESRPLVRVVHEKPKKKSKKFAAEIAQATTDFFHTGK